MSELGGPETFTPGEGGGRAPEALSEEAKQRFAAAAKQMKQFQREERRARKRDDRVAKTIIQFLSEEQHTHLFLLISRLVARDCPSIFILAILSLIHKPSLETVEEYVADHHVRIDLGGIGGHSITKAGHLPAEMNETLVRWISRLQLVMNIDGEHVIGKLMVDSDNIDGTVLQLTTFVLVEYFRDSGHVVPFEELQPLTVSILQTIFEPYLHHFERFVEERRKQEKREEDDEVDNG